MLLTNGKMLESLGILANIEEPGKLGYACARNRRILLTECKEFMDKRDELLRKYGKDKGNGQYELPAENAAAFVGELKEYSDLEFDVDVMTIPEDVFCGGKLTAKEMFILDWMVAAN